MCTVRFSLQWGFSKIWSNRPSSRPNLRGRNCPLSATGVKVSLVCSNSTVFLRMDIFSQYGELINSMRLFGSTTRVTRVSLTDMRNTMQQPCLASRTLRVIRVYCPTRANCFIRDTLVFVRAPSDVSSFVLKAISNENRELSHTTPEAAKSTPEAATLATLILPINRRVTRVV